MRASEHSAHRWCCWLMPPHPAGTGNCIMPDEARSVHCTRFSCRYDSGRHLNVVAWTVICSSYLLFSSADWIVSVAVWVCLAPRKIPIQLLSSTHYVPPDAPRRHRGHSWSAYRNYMLICADGIYVNITFNVGHNQLLSNWRCAIGGASDKL